MFLRPAKFVFTLAVLASAGLSGCAREFPRLCDVPERPRTSDAAERAGILERLEADRREQRRAAESMMP